MCIKQEVRRISNINIRNEIINITLIKVYFGINAKCCIQNQPKLHFYTIKFIHI